MKRFLLLLVLIFGSPMVALQPANAGELCADGWYSASSGSGTCSWHGGIAGGSGSKVNTYKTPASVYKAPAYKAPAPAYKAPAPAYKAPAPAYKEPAIGKSGITGFCSAMDRNKGRCR